MAILEIAAINRIQLSIVVLRAIKITNKDIARVANIMVLMVNMNAVVI